jgi:hypothetical protein
MSSTRGSRLLGVGLDPASDRLKGTYHQAVAQQKFDVSFARK